ncbi:DNA alkylation repair protein [Marisediminicola senii]|uniref:DNA alkylation repair protein n=1 Tax=Marisediminicola senii TaxID=2711233 RepID=UPI0013ECB634|nr:DNA alkylation repair protein [Marisediminicola senii]
MTEPADFIDSRLEFEGDYYRAEAERVRLGIDLRFYGASVGAVRGTVRDSLLRYPALTRDDITALSTELWSEPVFERRLAAVVLLQTRVQQLDNSDLTRIEGFIRAARHRALVDPLATDVVGPLTEQLDGSRLDRAQTALLRWAGDPDEWVRRAALLAPLRGLRSSGSGSAEDRVDAAARRLRAASAVASNDRGVALEAADRLRAALG